MSKREVILLGLDSLLHGLHELLDIDLKVPDLLRNRLTRSCRAAMMLLSKKL
jgi:hypothetical protein